MRKMNTPAWVLATLICASFLAHEFPPLLAAAGADFPELTGDYLDQPSPGTRPVLFAPGIVGTALPTRDVAMTPDGNEIYFCVTVGNYRYAAIMVTRRVAGRWTEPQVASFADNPDWLDLEPCISPDGQRFFFLSDRPDGAEEKGDHDIWVMDRQGDTWGEPYNLGPPVNSADSEFFPSVTRDGTIYFARSPQGSSEHRIMRARLVDGRYQEPEELGPAINQGSMQFNAFIAPDESYLIYSIAGKAENIGTADYYISFRDEQDGWSEPVNLGDRVNPVEGSGWSPYVSPDGRFFFFMSRRTAAPSGDGLLSYQNILQSYQEPPNGNAAIYWMDAGFLAELKDQAAGNADRGEPGLAGPYLGQTPPGDEPRIFAPGLISNGMTNRDVALSPAGDEMFCGLAFGKIVTILHSRLIDGQWTAPEVASFARNPDFYCFEPAFAIDGRTLYFLSNRATADQEQQPGWGNQNLYAVDRQGDGWSDPRALPAPVNSAAYEYYPSLTRDGTLYFTRSEPGGQPAIYRSRQVAGAYQEPERMPDQVNCGTSRYNAFVSPEESYLILCVQGHEQNIGPVDYFICFRNPDDTWTEAVNLGEKINAPASRAASACVSPDGQYLFFAASFSDAAQAFPEGKLSRQRLAALHDSPGNGSSDIYWIRADFLAGLRPR